MELIKKLGVPIMFLWGSSMSYIFVSSYYENEKKKKLIYDKFKDPNYNPFKPYKH